MEEHAGNCPSEHWEVDLPQGMECNGKEGFSREKKDFPGSGDAGTLHPQGCAGGMGVGHVQSRSRWRSLLRDVSNQDLQLSKRGNLTAPSQFPSQNCCVKQNTKCLRKKGFGNCSFSRNEICGISALRGLVYQIF